MVEMRRFWLIPVDENGDCKNALLPNDMLNYTFHENHERLPQKGEIYRVIVNVEPNGENTGNYRFRVWDVEHQNLQDTDRKEMLQEKRSKMGFPKVYVYLVDENNKPIKPSKIEGF